MSIFDFVILSLTYLLACALVLAWLERSPRTRATTAPSRFDVAEDAFEDVSITPARMDDLRRRLLLPLPATLGPRIAPIAHLPLDADESAYLRPSVDWLERTECLQTAADVRMIVTGQLERFASAVEMRVSPSPAGLGHYDVRWSCVVDGREAAGTCHVSAYTRASLVSTVRRLWGRDRVLRRAGDPLAVAALRVEDDAAVPDAIALEEAGPHLAWIDIGGES